MKISLCGMGGPSLQAPFSVPVIAMAQELGDEEGLRGAKVSEEGQEVILATTYAERCLWWRELSMESPIGSGF